MNADETNSPLVESRVRDFRPVFFEDEVWAVVEVVAVVAECLSLFQRHSDQFAGRFEIVVLDEFDVLAAGAVAVFALIAEQMCGQFFVDVSRVVSQNLLRMPAGDMTGEAFGVEHPRDPSSAFAETVEG